LAGRLLCTAGGHFHLQAEAPVEVRNVVVSALEGDDFDRQGAFFEQAGGNGIHSLVDPECLLQLPAVGQNPRLGR